MTRRGIVIGVGAVLLAGLTGCSQVAALAPVGGNHVTEVRYAAIDVLTDAGVDILTAPVCESATDGAVTCTGRTLAGDTITAVSPADDQSVVTVTVGTQSLYSGSIMDVLNEAARSTS